jgi:WhiB family transcriptional regulator, redox-sensing transcriptional regulator
VWGGFTEHERLQLLRAGWSGEMDVPRLEARLSSP